MHANVFLVQATVMQLSVSGNCRRLLLVLLAAEAAVPPVKVAASPLHRQLLAVSERVAPALWGGASSSSGELARSARALRADRCTGCDAGQCLPATGCASCDVVAGYQPDGAGGCTQGETLIIAATTHCLTLDLSGWRRRLEQVAAAAALQYQHYS